MHKLEKPISEENFALIFIAGEKWFQSLYLLVQKTFIFGYGAKYI